MDTLIASILDAVFSSLAESVGASDWLRDRFGRDPEKLAFRAALTQALTDAAQHFPGRDLRYFAEQLGEFGGPILARSLQPASPLPTAADLTDTWLTHLNLDSKLYYKADFDRFATILLESLHTHIENQPPLQWIAQLRTQKITADAAQRSAEAVEQSATLLATMHDEIQRLQERLERQIQTNTGGGAAVGGNVHTGGDFIGRDQITIRNYFMHGLGRLHIDYSARIEEFLLEYLGSRRKRVPFGGRSAQLAELDAWLNDRNAQPYYLMTAEAGRGKSALVCRWQAQLLTRPDVEVIFIPISIRFQTATQDVVFAALAARLAAMHSEEMQAAVLSADQWRATCQSYLRREPPDGKQLLVILDGLDEATAWTPGRGLFPGDPPEGLRVLITARQRAGDTGPEGWAATLGWDEEWLARQEMLPGLDRTGIQDALASMGNPLEKLATQVDLIGELFRLTKGDPLLVRLYVDALVGKGVNAAYLCSEDLNTIQPGLHGYFDRWWNEQNQQWAEEGRNPILEQAQLLTLLNAVAAALGPLTHSDIAAVSDLTNGLLVRRLVQTVSRWLIGDGKTHGYTFSHPRLGYYFWEQMGEAEQAAWDALFTEWGATILADLNNGTIAPKAMPRYLIQHYAKHLTRNNAPTDEFYDLMSDGWRRAWEEVDVTFSGFLNDIACAEAKAQAAYHPGQLGTSEAIVQQIKAALCRASISSLGHNLTPDLVKLAIIHKLRTPMQAFAITQFIQDDYQRYEMLASLVNHLPDETLAEALAIVKGIRNYSNRASILGMLAPRLPQTLLMVGMDAAKEIGSAVDRAQALNALAPYLPPALLNEAVIAARKIQDAPTRAELLSALALHLPEEQQREVLSGALAAAKEIQSESARAQALSALALHLPKEQQREVLSEALTAAKEIKFESSRVEALSALALHLPEEQQREIMLEALVAARKVRDKFERAELLSALAVHLPEEQQHEVLHEALVAALGIKKEDGRAEALIVLAPYLPLALMNELVAAARMIKDTPVRDKILCALVPFLSSFTLNDAVAVAQEIQDASTRAESLSALALHLPEEQQREVLLKALTATQEIQSESARARALNALALHLPEEQKSEMLAEALITARKIRDSFARAQALNALASYLPDRQQREVSTEALATARRIEYPSQRAVAMTALIPYLPKKEQLEALGEALTDVQKIGDGSSYVHALSALARHLPEEQQREVLAEALITARRMEYPHNRIKALSALAPYLLRLLPSEAITIIQEIEFESIRAEVLAALAPQLSPHLLAEAVAAARKIEFESSRAKALSALAIHLPKEQQSKVLLEAVATVKEIGEESHRVEALSALTNYLSPHLLIEAVTVARDIRYKFERAQALSALAPHLPKEQQSDVLNEALAVARTITYPPDRAEALIMLAPHLPKRQQSDVLNEALATTQKILLPSVCAKTLGALAPLMPPQLLTRAVVIAQEIPEDPFARANAFAALAPYLSPRLLTKVITAAQEIQDISARANAFAALTPYLSPPLLTKVIAAAQEIQNSSARASVLVALVPYLPETQRPEVLTETLIAVRAIDDNAYRAELFTMLVPHLPQAQQSEVLAEALAATKAIEGESGRANGLEALSNHLPKAQQSEVLTLALAAARGIESDSARASALGALIPHLTVWGKENPVSAHLACSCVIQHLSQRRRPEFVRDLVVLMPFILSLAVDEAPQAATGIFQMLHDVYAWWP